ncbi:MAG: dephospho-CoA kinase [Oscillospiraceae bacterium]|nr:dephospho-CoA kinase [Oscillospiraceae bacterium]
MKVIGITGPTGAGKTTALNVLRELGAEVIDADAVYHGLLKGNEELKATLTKEFGTDLLDEAMQVDRKKLAQAVYPDRLPELNAITHPFVVEEVDRQVGKAHREGKKAVAIDAIALIESGLGEKCDAVVTVLAPLELRLRRIMVRDGIDEAYARRRALAQQGEDFFRANSGYVLENGPDDTIGSFRAKALALFRELLEDGA